MLMQEFNKKLWMLLFNEGGKFTANELAVRLDVHVDYMMDQLNSMHRGRLIEKFAPEKGSRRLRYGITGTCQAPRGMCLAELQV